MKTEINKNKQVCPICEGTGKLTISYKYCQDFKMVRRKMAKILLDNGFSIRQVCKYVGYGSPRSVQLIKNGITKIE